MKELCQTFKCACKAGRGETSSNDIWGEPEEGLGVGLKQSPLWSDSLQLEQPEGAAVILRTRR